MLNPDFFTVEQNKEMGMWPPSDIAGVGVAPYVNRLKKDEVLVLDVGVKKGDNAVYLLEKCPKVTVYGVEIDSRDQPEITEVRTKNLKDNIRYFNSWNGDISFDVVCIDASLSELDSNMKTFYNKLKSGGIFCGNEHHLTHVKEALGKFRRESKIGTPIHIANGAWFWIKR